VRFLFVVLAGGFLVSLGSQAGCGDAFVTAPAPPVEQPTTCTGKSDCPAPSICKTYECEDDSCVAKPLDGPLPSTEQTPGDCHVSACKDGSVEERIDDNDVPQGEECVITDCVEGELSTRPADANTPCGVGGQLTCDGAGHCANCTEPAQCGASSFCTTRTCVMGECGKMTEPAGTPLPPEDQVQGDCKTATCDAMGNPEGEIDNDSDAPIGFPKDPCVHEQCSLGEVTAIPLQDGDACNPPLQNNECCDGKCCPLPSQECSMNGACLIPGIGGAGGG
jgi:hypothetical protein